MADVIRVRKLANPRRRKASGVKRRRKMSPKQIRIFGSKRQKAALKARRNGGKRSRATRRSRRSNPALLVTLGPAVNPRRKRRISVAKTKKHARRRNRKPVAHRRRRVRATANPVRHNRRRRRNTATRRRRRNPTRVVYVKRTTNRRRSRRNPSILGINVASKSGFKLIGGGLLGVTATKFLPTMLPASLFAQLGGSPFASAAISAAAAVAAGWLASRFDGDLGAGVYFGGFMQTASVALNAFLPSVYSAIGSPLAGMGDFAPARFAVPQNPMRPSLPMASAAMPAPAGSVPMNSSLGRAYPSAY